MSNSKSRSTSDKQHTGGSRRQSATIMRRSPRHGPSPMPSPRRHGVVMTSSNDNDTMLRAAPMDSEYVQLNVLPPPTVVGTEYEAPNSKLGGHSEYQQLSTTSPNSYDKVVSSQYAEPDSKLVTGNTLTEYQMLSNVAEPPSSVGYIQGAELTAMLNGGGVVANEYESPTAKLALRDSKAVYDSPQSKFGTLTPVVVTDDSGGDSGHKYGESNSNSSGLKLSRGSGGLLRGASNDSSVASMVESQEA